METTAWPKKWDYCLASLQVTLLPKSSISNYNQLLGRSEVVNRTIGVKEATAWVLNKHTAIATSLPTTQLTTGDQRQCVR